MSHLFVRSCCGAVLACSVTTQGAFADLTAQDVWSDWRDYMSGFGYEVSGSEAMSGNVLTVNDFAMRMTMPENAGTVSFGVPQMVFTENGDGTVSLSFPEMLPLRFEVSEDGSDVAGEIGLTQTDQALVISGSPQDMTYDYSAASVRMALNSLNVDGKAIPPEAGHLIVDMTGVSSRTQMKIGQMRDYAQTMTAATLSYDMAFQNPDSGDMGAFKGVVSGLSSDMSGKIPLNVDMKDFPALMAAGFGVDVKFAYEAGNTDMAVKSDSEDMTFVSSSQGGSFGVLMDAGRIGYSIAQMMPSVTVTSAEMPFPVQIDLSELGFSLDMPLAKSDDLQPFAFGLKLADFTMSDRLWGMFDPARVLPRDPATVSIETSGQVRVLADLMDPASMVAMETSGLPPAELHALAIPALMVSMIGASLTGSGDFTFDNTDLVSFDGMPAPRGVARLHIVGANGLIDRLIQMGLLPEQDAMGFRMMLLMFSVPGEGADTLNSTIEFNDQGQILANGQRIK